MATMVLVLPEVTDFCRLYLFRHPELDASVRDRATGSGAAPLSRRGRAQVLQWVQLLSEVPVAAVYSADQPQSQEPAGGLARDRRCDLHPEARLRDQDMGTWQGREWEEVAQDEGEAVRQFFTEFGEAAAPKGESLGQAVERMLDWWSEVASRSVGSSLAVVVPGSLLSGFTAAMLGMRLSRAMSLNLPHGGLGVLDVFGNGVRIATWNPDAL